MVPSKTTSLALPKLYHRNNICNVYWWYHHWGGGRRKKQKEISTKQQLVLLLVVVDECLGLLPPVLTITNTATVRRNDHSSRHTRKEYQ
jgi:hypothetical protein